MAPRRSTESLAEVVDRFGAYVERLERIAERLDLGGPPPPSPEQRRASAVVDARGKAASWAQALDGDALVDALRDAFGRDPELLAAALEAACPEGSQQAAALVSAG